MGTSTASLFSSVPWKMRLQIPSSITSWPPNPSASVSTASLDFFLAQPVTDFLNFPINLVDRDMALTVIYVVFLNHSTVFLVCTLYRKSVYPTTSIAFYSGCLHNYPENPSSLPLMALPLIPDLLLLVLFRLTY